MEKRRNCTDVNDGFLKLNNTFNFTLRQSQASIRQYAHKNERSYFQQIQHKQQTPQQQYQPKQQQYHLHYDADQSVYYKCSQQQQNCLKQQLEHLQQQNSQLYSHEAFLPLQKEHEKSLGDLKYEQCEDKLETFAQFQQEISQASQQHIQQLQTFQHSLHHPPHHPPHHPSHHQLQQLEKCCQEDLTSAPVSLDVLKYC